MGLETLSSNELLNLFIYDTTISSSSQLISNNNNECSDTSFLFSNNTCDHNNSNISQDFGTTCLVGMQEKRQKLGVEGRKKRRRRTKTCKNKEEAETQRMTHITVERNRRKQMNEHLAILRSLMPESYVQRADQASIVGGAIDFVKELEHLLQSLEAKKFLTLQQDGRDHQETATATTAATTTIKFLSNPFAQFFAYSQYTCPQIPNKYTSKSNATIADIEVTLIETHANLRILSRRRLRQLSKLVTGFHTLCLTILHLNVTTLEPLVLYSISAKVEEGCQFNSADDIAGAVNHMFRIIEEEAIPYVD